MSLGQGLSRGALLALALFFTALWFSTLEYRKLIKPDEGRYAEIAREMAATGDWITPRLNGIKYFEKPPLQYWMTAAAFRAFGENEWSARLWSGLTGFLGVVVAVLAGARLFGRTAGILAGIVLGSSLWYVFIGHINTLDMGFSFFLCTALAGFLLAQRAAPRSAAERGWMLAAWAGMALAVLSKGLAGLVLPGLALVGYCLVQRDFSALRRMHFATGAPLALAIAAPWFVAVSVTNPEFPRFFFVHEHFTRFLTEAHGRSEPAWYFVAVLAIAAMPWTAMAAHACVRAFREPRPQGFDARRFLVLWAGAILAFFSASDSKLPSYILPVLPALALLAADLLARPLPRALGRHLAAVAALAALTVAFLPRLAGLAGGEAPDPAIATYAQWLIAAGSLLALGCLAALWQNRRGRALGALATLGVSALLCAQIALQGHETLARSNSAYHIATQVKPLLKPGVPFYSVNMYEQTLPFYLQRTLTLVEYRDEMGFGLAQEPWLAVPTLDEFRVRWLRDAEAFAVMTPQVQASLRGTELPMRVVARDARRVIVARP